MKKLGGNPNALMKPTSIRDLMAPLPRPWHIGAVSARVGLLPPASSPESTKTTAPKKRRAIMLEFI